MVLWLEFHSVLSISSRPKEGTGGEPADPSLSGQAVAVYGATAHQEKKREERLGASPVLASAIQGFPLEPPTSTQSLDLSALERASGALGFQLHPLSFTNILRARTLKKKKNQLFKFECQALYREAYFCIHRKKKKWNWGTGWPDVITSEVGEVLFVRFGFFSFIFKVGVYRIRGPPWEISFLPWGWGTTGWSHTPQSSLARKRLGNHSSWLAALPPGPPAESRRARPSGAPT